MSNLNLALFAGAQMPGARHHHDSIALAVDRSSRMRVDIRPGRVRGGAAIVEGIAVLFKARTVCVFNKVEMLVSISAEREGILIEHKD